MPAQVRRWYSLSFVHQPCLHSTTWAARDRQVGDHPPIGADALRSSGQPGARSAVSPALLVISSACDCAPRSCLQRPFALKRLGCRRSCRTADVHCDLILSSGFLAFANHSGFLKAVEKVRLGRSASSNAWRFGSTFQHANNCAL